MANEYTVLKPILFINNIYGGIIKEYENAIKETETAYTYSLN